MAGGKTKKGSVDAPEGDTGDGQDNSGSAAATDTATDDRDLVREELAGALGLDYDDPEVSSYYVGVVMQQRAMEQQRKQQEDATDGQSAPGPPGTPREDPYADLTIHQKLEAQRLDLLGEEVKKSGLTDEDWYVGFKQTQSADIGGITWTKVTEWKPVGTSGVMTETSTTTYPDGKVTTNTSTSDFTTGTHTVDLRELDPKGNLVDEKTFEYEWMKMGNPEGSFGNPADIIAKLGADGMFGSDVIRDAVTGHGFPGSPAGSQDGAGIGDDLSGTSGTGEPPGWDSTGMGTDENDPFSGFGFLYDDPADQTPTGGARGPDATGDGGDSGSDDSGGSGMSDALAAAFDKAAAGGGSDADTGGEPIVLTISDPNIVDEDGNYIYENEARRAADADESESDDDDEDEEDEEEDEKGDAKGIPLPDEIAGSMTGSGFDMAQAMEKAEAELWSNKTPTQDGNDLAGAEPLPGDGLGDPNPDAEPIVLSDAALFNKAGPRFADDAPGQPTVDDIMGPGTDPLVVPTDAGALAAEDDLGGAAVADPVVAAAAVPDAAAPAAPSGAVVGNSVGDDAQAPAPQVAAEDPGDFAEPPPGAIGGDGPPGDADLDGDDPAEGGPIPGLGG